MNPRLSFALLWALMLHLSVLLFLIAVPLPKPQGAPGQGAGLELRLGSVAVEAPVLQPAASAVAETVRAEAVQLRPLQPMPNPPPPEPEAAASEPQPSRPAVQAAKPKPVAQSPGGRGGDRYLAALRAHLARYRPAYTVARGVATVRFRIAADGSVSRVQLLSANGGQELEAEALALVLRAEPMPRPPGGQAIELAVPLEFR